MTAPTPDRPVLVLGATGLLGHAVVDAFLARGVPVRGTCRRPAADVSWWPPFGEGAAPLVDGVDLARPGAVGLLLDAVGPSIVVNAAGVVPRRASDPRAEIMLNAALPHEAAAWCAANDGRLVTISTDCVFGHAPGGFTEDDPPTQADTYGASKALGEVHDLALPAVTLRTSFAGRELGEGTGLLEWFLSHRGSRVGGYTNVWWSGLSAPVAARTIATIALDHPDLRGLHHLAASRPIAKHELLVLARTAFDLDVEVEMDASVTSHRTLDGRRLAAQLGLELPEWPAALAELAADRRYDAGPLAAGAVRVPGPPGR